ncbi:hypothetical protein C8F04DRAFT_1008275, partial [Mycena alexandri]
MPTKIAPANLYPPPDMACKSKATKEASSGEPKPSCSYALRRHICPRCEKAFMTNGHLRRHSHTHTGEKNHPCPFPGCGTRCSRQDNLQQHYKTHLASYIPRKMSKPRKQTARVFEPTPWVSNSNVVATTLSPPEESYSGSSESSEYSPPAYDSSPPLSPPELVQATLPVQHTVVVIPDALTTPPASHSNDLLQRKRIDIPGDADLSKSRWANPYTSADADGEFIRCVPEGGGTSQAILNLKAECR